MLKLLRNIWAFIADTVTIFGFVMSIVWLFV